jgi:ubiquinone/menaquinone biosynthesis C-methylase UbiE
MSLFVPRRVDTPELLDEHDAPIDEMVRSLHDLRRINAWAGGVRAYRLLLKHFFGGTDAIAGKRVLDIGTGTCDLLLDAQRRFGIVPLGLDLKIDHLALGRALSPPVASLTPTGQTRNSQARNSGEDAASHVAGQAVASLAPTGQTRNSQARNRDEVARIAASAFQIPLRNSSVDVVTSSHFFHHFSPEENVAILGESLRVARRGVIVTDTRRNVLPLAFMKLVGALKLVGSITAYDGPASVLRGYTVEELPAVVSQLKATRHEIFKIMPFRFALMLWK